MSNLLKATHEGVLIIGNTELPVAVLQDGTRLISYASIFQAFGRTVRGAHQTGKSRVRNMPAFLTSNNLQPFISNELRQVLNPIDYESLSGKESRGYKAEILPLLCDVYLEARNARKENGNPVLTSKQMPVALSAEFLTRSLSKVGIIALVDEATGFEKEREKDALQLFLQKFLEDEKGQWVRTFPPEFFEAIFKMKGWTWKQANGGKKPQVVGHYINNYVYSRLAPKILDELRLRNPKDERGNRKGKHPQWINPDFGHPKLKEHLTVLTAFAKAAGYNWVNWERMVNRALPKFESDGSAKQELEFPED